MSPDYKKFGDNSEEAYITQMIPENMYWSGVADELEEERKIERATVAAEDGKNELLSDLSEKSKHESASSRHNTDKMYLAPTPNLGSPGHTNDPTQKSLSPNRTTLSVALQQPLAHSALIQLAPSLVHALQDLPDISDYIHIFTPEYFSES
ncbi:hypothetical protein AUEXF2481DRAFT_46 [Aureobasidium subglaciale EXF-2481]|uniref:Uncharacterized protein n=1 Tax=Aureobasidium subglaciale (strain EXF-2481) TaxID=1043005 RepID=A0A074YQY3_AURSE|nr:uncharacterized protein AUEXF2481DRAFT_46 [Aureobasidium subglaciale EXF-2481]KER00081.1 hypothetical protein AUEXF2481DRAFT_46 [Aureobasidium subglaciale EXF-2481]